MEIDKIPPWILALEQEDAMFLKNFVLKSGSLKEIAKLYEVSYPTVRLRLDKLIQKIELNDRKEDEPFSTFIKGLAVDSRIDLETAKMIIEKYRQEKGKRTYGECGASGVEDFGGSALPVPYPDLFRQTASGACVCSRATGYHGREEIFHQDHDGV